jgi:hypothetical protein
MGSYYRNFGYVPDPGSTIPTLPGNVVVDTDANGTLTGSLISVTELDYLQGAAGNIQNQITSNSTAIAGISGSVGTLSTQVAGISGTVGILSTEVAGISGTVGILSTEVAGISGYTSTISSSTGSVLNIQPSSDSTNIMTIKNASGQAMISVDSSNNNVNLSKNMTIQGPNAAKVSGSVENNIFLIGGGSNGGNLTFYGGSSSGGGENITIQPNSTSTSVGSVNINGYDLNIEVNETSIQPATDGPVLSISTSGGNERFVVNTSTNTFLNNFNNTIQPYTDGAAFNINNSSSVNQLSFNTSTNTLTGTGTITYPTANITTGNIKTLTVKPATDGQALLIKNAAGTNTIAYFDTSATAMAMPLSSSTFQMVTGNTSGYLWTNYSGYGDQIFFSFNHNSNLSTAIPDTGYGTAEISLSSAQISFRIGATNTAPSTVLTLTSTNLNPKTTNTVSLGSSSLLYSNVYTSELNAGGIYMTGANMIIDGGDTVIGNTGGAHNIRPVTGGQGNCGTSSNMWGNVYADVVNYVTLNNLSDRRMKKNIRPSTLGLSFLEKLEVVQYELKGKERVGLIAQDVEKVVEENQFEFTGVSKPREDDPNYGLNYVEMIPVLISAVQDQQKTIKEQQKLIEKMSAQVVSLQNQLNVLSSKI